MTYQTTRAFCPLCNTQQAINPSLNTLRKHRTERRRGAPICAGSGMIVFTPTEKAFALAPARPRSYTVCIEDKPLFTTTNQSLATSIIEVMDQVSVTARSAESISEEYEGLINASDVELEWFYIPEFVTEVMSGEGGAWSYAPLYRSLSAPSLIAVPRNSPNDDKYRAALTLTLGLVQRNAAVKSEVQRALNFLDGQGDAVIPALPQTATVISAVLQSCLISQNWLEGRVAVWAFLTNGTVPPVNAKNTVAYLTEVLTCARDQLFLGDHRPQFIREAVQRLNNLIDLVEARTYATHTC